VRLRVPKLRRQAFETAIMKATQGITTDSSG